uniref:Uncharacterized protein n=1 Tax=Cacopsylla melanoneura TaxID=428564 RepID=A0A8D9AB25_9HEMI
MSKIGSELRWTVYLTVEATHPININRPGSTIPRPLRQACPVIVTRPVCHLRYPILHPTEEEEEEVGKAVAAEVAAATAPVVTLSPIPLLLRLDSNRMRSPAAATRAPRGLLAVTRPINHPSHPPWGGGTRSPHPHLPTRTRRIASVI